MALEYIALIIASFIVTYVFTYLLIPRLRLFGAHLGLFRPCLGFFRPGIRQRDP